MSSQAHLPRREPELRLEKKGKDWEWAEVIRGVENLHNVEPIFRGQRFHLRSQLIGDVHKAISAAGVAVPPTLREVPEQPPPKGEV